MERRFHSRSLWRPIYVKGVSVSDLNPGLPLILHKYVTEKTEREANKKGVSGSDRSCRKEICHRTLEGYLIQ